MVLGWVGNGVTSFSDKITWSDLNDATWYDDRTGTRPASLAGGVGGKRIRSPGGNISVICGGQTGVIFKDRSMHALQFTGGNDIWRIDDISPSVGTSNPFSVVECSDGVRRFWGGDDFYEQEGIAAPSAIGNEGIKALLMSDNGSSVATARATMSLTGGVIGADDRRQGCVYWFYAARLFTGGGAFSSRIYRGLIFNYRTRLWASIVFPDTEIIGCAVTSHLFTVTLNHDGLVAVGRFIDDSPTTCSVATFTGANNYAITMATQRFSIAQDQAQGTSQKIRARAIQPVFTMNQVTASPDYRLETIPSTISFRLIASNEPHFQQQTDAAGSQVSPRSEARTVADASDWGWMGLAVEGRTFVLETTVPETSTVLRGLRGVWLDYEVVAG